MALRLLPDHCLSDRRFPEERRSAENVIPECDVEDPVAQFFTDKIYNIVRNVLISSKYCRIGVASQVKTFLT